MTILLCMERPSLGLKSVYGLKDWGCVYTRYMIICIMDPQQR